MMTFLLLIGWLAVIAGSYQLALRLLQRTGLL